MHPTTIWCAYWSPTGTTRRVVSAIADRIALQASCKVKTFDFTLPEARRTPPTFSKGDLVVCGTPVYAGRVPNLLAGFVAAFQGTGAVGIPVVLFGNRAYDDALMELRNLMLESGFQVPAAGAFIGEHAFGRSLAGGRPDISDLTVAKGFADHIFRKLQAQAVGRDFSPVPVRGNNPVGPYYRPRDGQGNWIDIRTVTPLTRDTCTDCKWCAKHCPMGSINYDHVHETPGICIKCNACVKGCPVDAKYFGDPGYLFHRDDLVSRYALPRKEPDLFF